MLAIQTEVSDGTLEDINVGILYLERADISVFLSTNPSVALVDGVDYQWNSDTVIHFLTGPVANGVEVTLRRHTGAEQMLNIYDGGGPFSRQTLDENFNQLLFLSQEFTEGLGLGDLQEDLNMNGHTIFNLAAGVNPGDAVNVSQFSNAVATTIRVPESVATLPPAAARANKALAFDVAGNPVVVATSGDATNLELRLADGITPGNGADMVGYDASNTVRDMISAIKVALGLVKNIVTDYGAVGDGIADDTPAFNAAIAAHNAVGGIDFLNVIGTSVFVPDGRYKISACTPITRSGFELIGASRSSAILLCQPGTSTFTFGDGVNIVVGGGLNNLKVEYLTTPTASTFFCTFDLAYRIKLDNFLIANIGTLVRCGITSARACGGITLSNIDGSKANVASGLIQLRFGAGLFIDNFHAFVPVAHPVHPASMTTVPGCVAFDCSVGFWDTVQADNLLLERFDQGLSIVAGATMVYQNFFFSNAIFDYHRRYCVYLESQASGVISGIRFDDTSWFVSWESNVIELVGVGYHDNHNFGGKIVIGGANGVQYSLTGSTTRNIVFNGLQINSVNRTGAGNAALNFAANTVGFTVIGCKGNVDTTAIGFPWRAPFGVAIGANADHYVCTGNKFEGSTNGWSVATNTTPSTQRFIGGNAGANYAGGAGLALPASGATLNNVTPYKVDVHVNGGTVTSISSRGVPLPNMTGGFLTMDPGQSLSITYSVAPAFQTFARS